MKCHLQYLYLQRVRRIINPNISFWRQLIDYEKRIFGRSSVEIVDSNIGPVPDVYITETKPPSMPHTRKSSDCEKKHRSVITTDSNRSSRIDRTGRPPSGISYGSHPSRNDKSHRADSLSGIDYGSQSLRSHRAGSLSGIDYGSQSPRSHRTGSLSGIDYGSQSPRSHRTGSLSGIDYGSQSLRYDRSHRAGSVSGVDYGSQSPKYDRSHRAGSVSGTIAGQRSTSVSTPDYIKPRSQSLTDSRKVRTIDPSLGVKSFNYTPGMMNTDYNRSYIYRKYHTGI